MPAQDDRLHVRVAVASLTSRKFSRAALLARERLQHAHAGDVLGERRGDGAERLAHGAVGAAGALAEPARSRAPSPASRSSDASASRQSRKKRTTAVPTSVSVFCTSEVTPSVTSWSSASTSFVSRLMITPARLRS